MGEQMSKEEIAPDLNDWLNASAESAGMQQPNFSEEDSWSELGDEGGEEKAEGSQEEEQGLKELASGRQQGMEWELVAAAHSGSESPCEEQSSSTSSRDEKQKEKEELKETEKGEEKEEEKEIQEEEETEKNTEEEEEETEEEETEEDEEAEKKKIEEQNKDKEEGKEADEKRAEEEEESEEEEKEEDDKEGKKEENEEEEGERAEEERTAEAWDVEEEEDSQEKEGKAGEEEGEKKEREEKKKLIKPVTEEDTAQHLDKYQASSMAQRTQWTEQAWNPLFPVKEEEEDGQAEGLLSPLAQSLQQVIEAWNSVLPDKEDGDDVGYFAPLAQRTEWTEQVWNPHLPDEEKEEEDLGAKGHSAPQAQRTQWAEQVWNPGLPGKEEEHLQTEQYPSLCHEEQASRDCNARNSEAELPPCPPQSADWVEQFWNPDLVDREEEEEDWGREADVPGAPPPLQGYRGGIVRRWMVEEEERSAISGASSVGIFHLNRLLDELDYAAQVDSEQLREVWWIVSNEMADALHVLPKNTGVGRSPSPLPALFSPQPIVGRVNAGRSYPSLKYFFHHYNQVTQCFNNSSYSLAVSRFEAFRARFEWCQRTEFVRFFRLSDFELLRRMFFRHWLLTAEPESFQMTSSADVNMTQKTEEEEHHVVTAMVESRKTTATEAAEQRRAEEPANLGEVFRDFYCLCDCELHMYLKASFGPLPPGDRLALHTWWLYLREQLELARDAGRQLSKVYDPASGGLDPQCAAHAVQCLLDIESKVQEGRYDWCWQRMDMLHVQFDSQENVCIWKFVNYSDEDILQLVFYHMNMRSLAG